MSTPDDQTAVIFDRPSAQPEHAASEGRSSARMATIIVVTALVVLTVILLIGDWIARAQVERAIATEVVAASDLPPTQQVAVSIAGPVIPQLLMGRFSEVVVTSDNVNIGAFGGDFSFTLTGVPVDSAAELDSARGEVRISAPQAEALFGGLVDVAITDTEMSFGASLTAGGKSLPLAVAVSPGIDSGRMTTTLTSMTLGETVVSADEAGAQLGPEAAAAMQPAPTCIADAVPAGVRVTDVSLRNRELVLSFTVDPRIAVDAALQQPGSCV